MRISIVTSIDKRVKPLVDAMNSTGGQSPYVYFKTNAESDFASYCVRLNMKNDQNQSSEVSLIFLTSSGFDWTRILKRLLDYFGNSWVINHKEMATPLVSSYKISKPRKKI